MDKTIKCWFRVPLSTNRYTRIDPLVAEEAWKRAGFQTEWRGEHQDDLWAYGEIQAGALKAFLPDAGDRHG